MIILKESHIFKRCYLSSFHNPILNGISVTPTSQICAFAMLFNECKKLKSMWLGGF